MSEFWVSRKKWTCKYCDVTINDDVPSRQQHENGLRHKGNVERSLRQAYKKSERDRNDERHAKRGMEKIERLALQSHAKDLAGTSSPSTLATPTGPTELSTDEESKIEKGKQANRTSQAWKPTNRLATYGSALPIYDASGTAEEEEKKLSEWQELQEAKSKEGTAGDWETVTPVPSMSKVNHEAIPNTPAESSSDRDQAKSFKVREKQGHFRIDEDDENDSVEIKVKKRIKIHNEAEKLKQGEEEKKRMMPEWRPMRLDTGISAKEEDVHLVPVERLDERQAGVVDLADGESKSATEPSPVAETETEVGSTMNPMFKKRKSGAGAGAKRVRAVI